MKDIFKSWKLVGMVLAVFAATILITPAPAAAKYRDRSDELPGMSDFPTELVIIGAVVVAGVIFLAVKGKSHKTEKPELKAPQPAATETPAEAAPVDTTGGATEESSLVVPESQRSGQRVNLFFNVTDSGPGFSMEDKARDFSEMTVRVGFTFGF